MKRGFLQAKGKVAPAQAEAKPLKPVLIPISPQAPPGTQIVNIDSLTLLNLNVVSMPQLNIPTSFLLYTGTKEAILKELGHMKVEPPPLALPFTIEEVPGQVKELEVEPPPLALPFTIEEVPGQGHGTFAKNAFNTGDLIWDEHPLLVFPQVFNPYSVYTRERCVELAIERLVPALRDMFYMLHNCKSNDPKDVDGICATNAIDIGRFPGPHEYGHAAVFLLISRFNHSCVPNAQYYWNTKTMKGYLTASRHIGAGEQIHIAYCPIFESRAERQKQLREKYGFTCACASCGLPKDLSARSDVKRKVLSSALAKLPQQQKEHEHGLKEWIKDLSLPDDHVLKPAQFLMQLMQEEQAIDSGLWLTQAEIACKALCALSDRAGVVELASKASAYARTTLLGDHAGWSKVAAAPEKTVWWGLRKKVTN